MIPVSMILTSDLLPGSQYFSKSNMSNTVQDIAIVIEQRTS